ncbi:MAG: DUF5791 family protein [Halodesulfurarchaeum sp.]|nr:DUF5791 family protein [Halodesulfurarchaeum sp.]
MDEAVLPSADVTEGGTVGRTYANLLGVLGTVLTSQDLAIVAGRTGINRQRLEAIVSGATAGTPGRDDGLTLGMAATILATESTFSPSEVRARCRDHLLVQMSRGPIDAESLAAAYGFGDAGELRAKIDGDRPLPLREYARLRVAVDR